MSAPHQTLLHGGYDQSLLSATPEPSRAARQEGYNVDLLDENRSKPPSRSRTVEGPEPTRSKENYPSLTPESPVNRAVAAPPRKVPFWRTRKGIITLAVLAIVIIGAVVGGAVGGTVAHNNKNNDISSTNTTLPGGQQTGAAPSSPPPQSSSPSGTGAAAPTNTTAGLGTQPVASFSTPPSTPPSPNVDSIKSTAAAPDPAIPTRRRSRM